MTEVRLTPWVEAWPGGRRGWKGESPPHGLRAVRGVEDLKGLEHDLAERYRGETLTPGLLVQVQTEITLAMSGIEVG